MTDKLNEYRNIDSIRSKLDNLHEQIAKIDKNTIEYADLLTEIVKLTRLFVKTAKNENFGVEE